MNDIFSRIGKLLPDLKRAERRIAELILSDVDLVLKGSITEVADAASVSASSITRFSRMLGVEGFKDLKLSIAQAKSAQSPFAHQSVQDLDERAIAGGQLEEMYLQQITASLRSTYASLDAEALTDAIAALRSARRVRLFGVAVSGLMAEEAAMRLMRLGLDACYIGDSHFRRISSTLLGPGDVAVVVSHTGRSQETVEAAEIARGAGATVIGISAPHNPLTQFCDILIGVSVYEEIDIYTPSISHFSYHYVIGLIAFHIGQSSKLNRDELLDKIKGGLAWGQIEASQK
ncbi:MurR/RpiR family transcriptional regulator [Thalassovita aquimarina]|uniref:MurR/RpiR family transcriptional regulator n=1 Tax=Thalassovita aquimarina TaxID=2785917 RepID=A0ABS5HW09_9RHOB|nr:MurR/RpiR family transcriptional regulator [Thalassovita aquimarina]